MPAKKRTKSSKKPAKKGKHALSPTEKELLDCCENRQPVLLYGKDDYDREKLVRKIHSRNGGIRRSWEYQGNDKNIKSADDLENEIVKAENDGNRKRIRELLLDCNDTIRTYTDCDDTFRIYITGDSNLLSGQEVFKGLSSFRHKHSGVNGKVINLYLYEKNLSWTDDTELLQYKGTLFIDNLGCQDEDKEWYRKIGKQIESHKRSVHKSQRGWLVFYAYDYTTFPQQFLDQVEPVSLDSKDYEVEEQKKEIVHKKKDNLDDVKLKMNVDWKGSYSFSHFEVSVKCKKSLDNEFKLSARFMPVLFLLVKGVVDGSLLVTNTALKKAYRDPNEAKKEITKSFANVIGSRAKTIIEIVWGEGKKLRIPKKNITLQEDSPF